MKYLPRIKGKRAGILGSMLSNFWSYVLFVFVVLVFFVFFNIQTSNAIENRIANFGNKADLDITLINFLRTPIEVIIDGKIQEMTMADLIIEYYIDAISGKERFDMDENVKKHLSKVGDKRRLMIYFVEFDSTLDPICPYDSRNKGILCGDRNSEGFYFQIPEGIVRLPVPMGIDEFKSIEVVLQ